MKKQETELMKVYFFFKQKRKGEKRTRLSFFAPGSEDGIIQVCVCIGLQVRLEVDHMSVA